MATNGKTPESDPHANAKLSSVSQRKEKETESQCEDEAFNAEVAMTGACFCFATRALEGQYLVTVSEWRRHALLTASRLIGLCSMVHAAVSSVKSFLSGDFSIDSLHIPGLQILSLTVFYTITVIVNWRSRKVGGSAAKQEDFLLSVLVAVALATMLASLHTNFHYVYACFFLMTTTTVLKIRWWMGSCIVGIPVAVVCHWRGVRWLSPDIGAHLLVAWCCCVLLSYQADYYRRHVFVGQLRAERAWKRKAEEVKARVKAEHELAIAQAQAARRSLRMAHERAANEAKSEFMRVMCHEVRTPLNGCLAAAEMLLDTPLQEEQRDLAQIIRVSGSILLSTVSNFLDFVKLEAGRQLEIVLTEINLEELLTDLHSIIQATIGRSSEVDLKTPRMTDVPEVVLTDPDRLRGIILNLYTNAAKFTMRGFIDLSVSVSSRDRCEPPDSGYSNITITPSYPHRAKNGLTSLRVQCWPGDRLSLKHRFMLERRSMDSIPRTQLLPGDLSHSLRTSESEMLRADMLDKETDRHLCESENVCSVEEGDVPRHNGSKVPFTSRADPVVNSLSGDQFGRHTEGCVTPRWLLFEVVDSGVGISEKGLHSLFQEYVQGATEEMSRPRTRAGTGLGLSICSKQVAILGGRIGAYSKLGTGSVFWFTIPLMTPTKKKAAMRRCASWTSDSVFSGTEHRQREAARAQSKWPLAHRLDGKLPIAHRPGGPCEADPENRNSMFIIDPGRDFAPGEGIGYFPGRPCNASSEDRLEAGRATSPGQQQELPIRNSTETQHFGALFEFLPNQGVVDTNKSILLGAISGPMGSLSHDSDSLDAHVPGYNGFSEVTASGEQVLHRHSNLDAAKQTLDVSSLKGRRVLLAEDNVVNQTVGQKLLASLGMKCTVVANGIEVVDIIHKGIQEIPFDVILMDMSMPFMSGIKATRQLRAKGLKVPIIAMTANASERDWEECRAAGMNGFLSKPVLKTRLAEALMLVMFGPGWYKDEGMVGRND